MGKSPIVCPCGTSPGLFWLKDEVWKLVKDSSSGDGHWCLECTERIIGRPLTLHDLSVKNYARTAKNTSDEFMRNYLRAKLTGIIESSNLQPRWNVPTGKPFDSARKFGEHLAKNTGDFRAALDRLAIEVDTYFPEPMIC